MSLYLPPIFFNTRFSMIDTLDLSELFYEKLYTCETDICAKWLRSTLNLTIEWRQHRLGHIS